MLEISGTVLNYLALHRRRVERSIKMQSSLQIRLQVSQGLVALRVILLSLLALSLRVFHHTLKLHLLGVLAIVECLHLSFSFLLTFEEELPDFCVLLGLLLLCPLIGERRLRFRVSLRLLTFVHVHRKSLDVSPELCKLIFCNSLHVLLHLKLTSAHFKLKSDLLQSILENFNLLVCTLLFLLSSCDLFLQVKDRH